MPKLYEITTSMRAWLLELEDNEGELSPELEQKLDDINNAFEAKVEACVYVLEELEQDEQAFREQARRFSQRASQIKRSRESLKSYILHQHIASGKSKTVTQFHTVAVRKSPTKVDAEAIDLDAIDESLVVVKRSPNLKEIKRVLESGQEVPGARLVTGQHLSVRLGKMRAKATEEN